MAPAGFSNLCASWSRNMHSCLPLGWRMGMDSQCWAKSWNWPKCTNIYYPGPLLEGASKSSINFKVPKYWHQTDYVSVIVLWVGKYIFGAVYCATFPEFSPTFVFYIYLPQLVFFISPCKFELASSSFISVQRTPFSISHRVSQLAINSLSFCLSGRVLISHLFFKNCFLSNIDFLVDDIFF